MDEQRQQERRQRYSFRQHLGRLKARGQLKHVGLATIAALVIGGITFARCQSSRITGPGEAARPQTGPGASGSITTDAGGTLTTVTRTATAVFPADLLPSFHPCMPDVTFVESSSSNEITYTDEPERDATGQPTGNRKVTYDTNEKQNAKDKNGNKYAGQKQTRGNTHSFSHTNSRGKIVSHMNVKGGPGEGSQTCTQTFDPETGREAGGGNACPDFESEPTYELVWTETDPLSGAGVLTVLPVSLAASCGPVTASATEQLLAQRD